MVKKKEQKIETMLDLKRVLNKISDNDLSCLAFGFNADSDGSPNLLAYVDDNSEDDAHAVAMHIFGKKSVSLVHKYFNKIIEAVQLFDSKYGEDAIDYYINEPIDSSTKFNKHI